jgi:hypothetical protein
MVLIVIDDLACPGHLGAGAGRLGRIEVAVKAGEIAAGYLNSHFVAGQESVACHPEVNFVTINPAGLD